MNNNKRDEINQLLIEHSIDILGITENEDIEDSEIKF